MKILKEGIIPTKFRPKRFECEECGCVFEASNSEYRVVRDNSTQETLAESTCPSCGCDVYTLYY